MNEAAHTFRAANEAFRYMFAGHATVTFQSSSGQHFTYQIRKADSETNAYGRHTTPPVFFVSVLYDGSNYRYIGYVRGTEFKPGSKGTPDAESFAAFKWTFGYLLERAQIHPKLTIRHEGTCGCCGRQLTHPESIDSGIGPVCARRVA